MTPVRTCTFAVLLFTCATSLSTATRSWDAGGGLLSGDDLMLFRSDLRAEWGGYAWDNAVTLSYARTSVDYRPAAFDARGFENGRRENRYGAQATFQRRARGRFRFNGVGAVYDGFGDFQSVWLAEYYRQQFSNLSAPNLDTWEPPSPRGIAASVGVQWEARRGLTFIELSYTQARDEIAPGYEIDFDGLRRGRKYLNTRSLALRWEQVANARLRTLVELTVSDTSERELRWNGSARAFWSLSDRWVLRGEVGGATENPDFEALFGGLTLDASLGERWALLVNGRAYYDSGELQNDGLFSTAAPALRTYTASIGARYRAEAWTATLTVGGIHSNYTEGDPGLDFFQHLYRDRDLFNLRAAVSHGF